MPRPFNSELILEEKISESTLRAYHVGFDQNTFRLGPLVDVIRSVIPEYALGYYCGKNIPLTEIVTRLKEAAELVYDTDNFKSRGEFGELVLHLLLRDFCSTVPLISKIYFKDSQNCVVHGFDGVQINPNDKKLWLGESKFYTSGADGIKDLAADFIKHTNSDYLRKEFSLLSRKIPDNIPEIEHWRTFLSKHNKLEKIFKGIVIPLVCTYTSNIFKKCNCENEIYLHLFEKECKTLRQALGKQIITTDIDFVLMLLPVENKLHLNSELHERLKAMQSI